MNDLKVFACNSAEDFTKEICENLGIEMGKKDSFKFANDNNFVQLKETVREKDVYIVQTTQPPVNERIMELLITIEAAKNDLIRQGINVYKNSSLVRQAIVMYVKANFGNVDIKEKELSAKRYNLLCNNLSLSESYKEVNSNGCTRNLPM